MTRLVVLSLVVLLNLSSAWAQGGTCPAELAAVDPSLEETMQRLQCISASDSLEVKCAAIRHRIDIMRNLADMFSRCTTGHARGENMGQALGTAADFEDIAEEMNCP